MEVRLYVGNLPKSTNELDLKTLFGQAGSVSAVEVIKERGSGESRGFAFVTMSDQGESEKAIQMFSTYAIGDRQIKVDVARPRIQTA